MAVLRVLKNLQGNSKAGNEKQVFPKQNVGMYVCGCFILWP